jgi:hypothetical protein
LNFAGAVNQTVVLDATSLSTSLFDASSATGNVTLTTIDQTSVGDSTDVTVNGGAGNDTFTMLAIDSSDSVNGGDGTDTIITDTTNAAALDGATRSTFTNIEGFTVNDTLIGNVNVNQIDSVNR